MRFAMVRALEAGFCTQCIRSEEFPSPLKARVAVFSSWETGNLLHAFFAQWAVALSTRRKKNDATEVLLDTVPQSSSQNITF